MGKIVLNLTRKLVDPGPVNWEEWQDALDEEKKVGRPKLSEEEWKRRRKENHTKWRLQNADYVNKCCLERYYKKKFGENYEDMMALRRLMKKHSTK
jgi:hypothetical protein